MTPRPRVPIVVAVALVAAVCFWPGMIMPLEWVDQGLILYPAWRVARGELPYRDVPHIYGPSLFFLNGSLLRWLGEDLLVIRLGLLVVKAALAALIFLLARTVARPWIAFMVTAWFVAMWSSPLWVFSTPYAMHYTLACSLAGLAILVGHPAGGWPTALVAGLCFGLGATFKQTTGLFVGAGALVVLGSTVAQADERDGCATSARMLRLAVMTGTALLVLAYPGRALGTWTLAVVAAPLLGLAWEWRRDASSERILEAGCWRLTRTLGFGLGFAIPIVAWAAFYASRGALRDLVHDTLLGLPQRIAWFVPLTAPDSYTLMLTAAIVVGAAALRVSPGTGRTVVLGLAALAASAVVAPPRGGVSVTGLRYLPLAMVWAAAPIALRTRAEVPRLLWWYGAVGCLSLYPSSDVLHALMILPAILPLLALLLERMWSSAGKAPLARAFVVVLAGAPLIVPAARAVSSLAQATGTRPARFERASRIQDDTQRSGELRQVLAELDRTTPRGAPLLVLPSAQLFYVLADRPSALPKAEMVLYLLTVGAIAPENARALVSEAELLEGLRQTRPVIVRSPDQGWLRIAAAFPDLARWIETQYTVAATFGTEQVLRSRHG